MNHQAFQESDAQISRGVALAYSSLTIPITAVGLPLSVYLPPLYATEVGLSLASVGFIFMLARFWDVFTDPLLGILVDRYPSRWGRRKHWIALGSPLLMVSAFFTFMPDPGVDKFYLLGWLFILYLGFTLIDVSHKSWAPDLAKSYNDRSRLFGWREGVNLLGSIAILLLPVLFDQLSETPISGKTKAAAMGWFLIITLPITVVVALRYVPDKIDRNKKSRATFDNILSAIKNEIILRVFVAEFFVALCVSSSAAMYLFVAKWVFELERYGSLSIVVYFIGGVLAVPFWVKLSNIKSKHIALIISCVYYAFVLLGYLLVQPKGSLVALFGLSLLSGFGFTAPQVLIRSMVADVVDQEELRSGRNYAGLYYAFMSTVYKLGGAIAVGVAYFTLGKVGFDPAIENSSEAIHGLFLTFVFLPLFFSLLTAVTLIKYPLTRDLHKNIRQKLEENRSVLTDPME